MPEIRSALLRTVPFLIVIIVIAVLKKKQKINTDDIDLRKPESTQRFLSWLSFFFLFTLLVEFFLYVFNLLELSPWTHSTGPSLILVSGAVILAPIAEEILFRGFILNFLLNKQIKLHLAIFIQAVFFVLLHNFTYENTVSSTIGIIQSLIDASFFAYARIQTKSLYTPMTMHICGNAIAILERFLL